LTCNYIVPNLTDHSHALGFVLASEYRKKVLLVLQDGESRPSTISEKTKIYSSHISKTLSELVEKKLVICTTPELKKGRLYELTKEGRSILKYLN